MANILVEVRDTVDERFSWEEDTYSVCLQEKEESI